MRYLLAALLLCFPLRNSVAGTEINALAWPALSPDGETLAFEWLNDLWLAPSGGGEAKRIVKSPGREAYPKFTNDGRRLVFSSERTGSVQLYSVEIDGGDLRMHTRHTEGNVLEALAPDGTYAIVRGIRERSGYRPDRLMKVDLTREARELRLFDATAHSASLCPDRRLLLFCRGGEQLYRKGYRGSRSSSIHLYDQESGSFEQLISEEWEARSPLWAPGGAGFYYVSSRSGAFNIWSRNLVDAKDRQLTFFEDDSVILPALSANGEVMVFRAGQSVFRFHLRGGEKPEAIRFFTNETVPDHTVRRERISGTSSVAFGPGADRIVFSAAGDLWAMAAGEEDPQRLTSTDGIDELEPVLSPDGNGIYFLKDDGLGVTVCHSSRDEGGLGEVRVVSQRPGSKRAFRISPDGAWLSWVEAPGNLVTARADGGAEQMVMPGWDMPTYDWSPDGKWLVVAAKDVHSNRDIFLVPADGSRDAHNLTRNPAFEGSPKWSPDGSKIVFTARRDDDGLARLWLADIGIGELDMAKVSASVRPLGTDISEPTRIMWALDSRAILFQSRDLSDKAIYQISLENGEVSDYAPFRGIPVGADHDGRTFWRVDRSPTVFHEGVRRDFGFSFSVRQDRSLRSRLGFRRIWRTLQERFYDGTMNGKDWPEILGKYEDAAAGSLDSRQFDRVVAQLLGELNASHLTFRTKPWGGGKSSEKALKETAHPGLLFEDRVEGALVVKRVIPGTPIAKSASAPGPGDIVRKLAGKRVDAVTPFFSIFNGAERTPLPLVVESEQGGERTKELQAVSYGRARFLDREEKERQAALAAAGGEHRIVYLPFRRMKKDDLKQLEIEVHRASLGAEGVILDLRDNAGGRVADELLAFFSQPVHSFTVPRNGPRGYPTDRRVRPAWDGPLVVLCNENTYSNGEIFCHAVKHLKRGKLVGMPTNGGVISAVNVRIPEVGELQVPFRGWFHAGTGQDLELNGAVPDEIVPLLPEHQVAGRDPQLEKAIEVMAEEIANWKGDPRPILKSER